MTTYEPADWRPKPGDVAEVEWNRTDRPQVRILADVGELRWWGEGGFVPDYAARVVRRLQVVDPASVVTLDPNNPDDLERLLNAVARHCVTTAALRSLLPMPPLPEPNGLGAVVEWHGSRWLRAYLKHDLPWLNGSVTPSRARWDEFDSVVVLTHGWGCTCGGPGCPGGDA